MAYTASGIKPKSPINNFAGLKNDANRVAMTGALGNLIQTIDATATPVVSPVTIAITQTLTVPQGAVSVTIVSVTNAVQISEDSTQSAFFTLPAAIPFTIDVANQQFLYLKVGSSTVVSFMFKIV